MWTMRRSAGRIGSIAIGVRPAAPARPCAAPSSGSAPPGGHGSAPRRRSRGPAAQTALHQTSSGTGARRASRPAGRSARPDPRPRRRAGCSGCPTRHPPRAPTPAPSMPISSSRSVSVSWPRPRAGAPSGRLLASAGGSRPLPLGLAQRSPARGPPRRRCRTRRGCPRSGP